MCRCSEATHGHAAGWQGWGKMLPFQADEWSLCLNNLKGSHQVIFTHCSKQTTARIDFSLFAPVQMLYFSVQFPLTRISLPPLGSEILGLYIYGCLYLWDGDQGKNFSMQPGSPPLLVLRLSASGKLEKEGGTPRSCPGSLERWRWWEALPQEQRLGVASVQRGSAGFFNLTFYGGKYRHP